MGSRDMASEEVAHQEEGTTAVLADVEVWLRQRMSGEENISSGDIILVCIVSRQRVRLF